MSKKSYVLTCALIVASGFMGAALSGRGLASESSQIGQAGEAKKAGPPRWEHCAIIPDPIAHTVSFGEAKTSVNIIYFQEAGYREETVVGTANLKQGGEYRARANALAKAIARLGDEGWEMVGPARFHGIEQPDAIYLKKLRP